MLSQVQNQKAKIPNLPDPRHVTPDPCSLPRFVITLTADATDGLIRVPLAITGRWVRGKAEFAITREDLESIVRNFRDRQNGEINVDYDHASEMPEVAAGGPVPSAGRIVRLDAPELMNGSGESGVGSRENSDSRLPTPYSRFLLYGWFEPTSRARELLQNREYRFISPAIEWGARSKRTGKPQGTTLTSVALTNRPFLDELPQIRLSDPTFQPVDENEKRNSKLENRDASVNSPVSNFQFRVSNPGGPMKHVTLCLREGKIHIAHDELKEEFFFEPDDLKSVGAVREAPLPPDAAAAFSESGVINYAQARALLSEADAQGKFIPAAEVFHAQAEHELEEAVRAGKVLPRQRDDWRRIALSDLPAFRRLMNAQKPVVPLAPVGFAGTPPADVQAQVKFLAEQRMRERQISFGQALSDIGREQPDLVQQYRRAVSSME
ncbi:MAG: phage protease [Acidobacteriia bacterium]|nr:phage protease [Terriglobia bacterium]